MPEYRITLVVVSDDDRVTRDDAESVVEDLLNMQDYVRYGMAVPPNSVEVASGDTYEDVTVKVRFAD